MVVNGANAMSDIEGKVAREAMSECGQRVNFNGEIDTSSFGLPTLKARPLLYPRYGYFLSRAASTFAEHSAHSGNIISGTPEREWSEWDERHGR